MPRGNIERHFTVTPDPHGGVTIWPRPSALRSIDRVRRQRTRDAALTDPPSAEAERYVRHADFLPGGKQPPRDVMQPRRQVLFTHVKRPEDAFEIERDGDSVTVVLVSPPADLIGATPPGASGEGTTSRDHVHRLHAPPGGDPMLKQINRDNARYYDSGELPRANYKPGSDASKIAEWNERNRAFWGRK